MSNFLPNELIARLNKDPNFDTEAFVHVHEHEQKTSSVRINPLKLQQPEDALDLDEQVPWCETGFFLKERPVYTLDPLFHAGCYYPQEASSMFLAHAIQSIGLEKETIRALDLCAAPGGKSTLLNSYLSADSLLVSNEIIKTRANILEENIVKWGPPNVVVTNNDPSSFARLPGYFNLLVVDAPCSGSGMFRKDRDAIDEWSEANVKLCAERQRRILADSVACLTTDGYLFYSTCSYSEEENEAIVDWLIDEFDMESVPINVDKDWAIDLSDTPIHKARTFRFYPHKVKGEGFFFAALKKKAIQPTFSRKKIKLEKNNAPQDELTKWVDSGGVFGFLHQDGLHIFPKQYETDLKALQNVLYLKNAGTRLGKWTGKDLIPAHDLALSNRLNGHIAHVDVDLETALQYLRKENLDVSINTSGKTGWLLLRYHGVSLGWIKALPYRINNYYPKEIRIVSL